MFWRRRTEPVSKWRELADYNARVYEGVAHTPEYMAKMAVLQEQFDHEMGNRRPA